MAPLTTSQSKPAWQLQSITKRFPGVVANDQISFALNVGEIHGLMGENGCGKSTIIKSLMGVHQPDEGKILRDGEVIVISDPVAARQAGIAAVYQEFSLVPSLTVAENIHLGRLPTKAGRVQWKQMERDAVSALATLNVEIDPQAIVGDLSVAQQQLVEIAKAIAAEATLIILDEPTTALGLQEIAELHVVLKRLKEQGAAILYVSHRLDEVVQLVDCVTVLKDGKVVSTAAETEVSISAIVGAMIGDVDEHYPKVPAVTEDVLLRAENLSTAEGISNVTFDVHRGEVLGLGGVLGSGRTEIAHALFGVDRLLTGSVSVDGKKLSLRSPEDAVKAGIALVPENRKFDGLFFNFPGLANISIARMDRFAKGGVLRLEQERELGRLFIKLLEITPSSETQLVGFLSGGNQQKIVIARWLFAGAEVFVLDEPTQGIDVGAKIAVYNLINELTAAGKAVILISSDHDELLAMSDRIAIVSHGEIVDIKPASALDKTDLVRASAEDVAA